jgi:hydroxymethylglutaryl-CoA reductase
MDYKAYLYNEFPLLLKKVEPSMPAKWGSMNAHQMVEHLTLVLSIANGRMTASTNAEPERLAYRKMRFFEKDVPFPKNVRADFVPEEPVATMFPTIEQSKEFLMIQLLRFMDYHEEHEGLMPVHPVFGPMNYQEWIRFQVRHIKHHLSQFGLIPEQ